MPSVPPPWARGAGKEPEGWPCEIKRHGSGVLTPSGGRRQTFPQGEQGCGLGWNRGPLPPSRHGPSHSCAHREQDALQAPSPHLRLEQEEREEGEGSGKRRRMRRQRRAQGGAHSSLWDQGARGLPRTPVGITVPAQPVQQDAADVPGPGCGHTFFLCPNQGWNLHWDPEGSPCHGVFSLNKALLFLALCTAGNLHF